MREKAQRNTGKRMGPLEEATIVRLKSGGPEMTVEDIRESESLVQCIWFDHRGRTRRDAFHIKALEIVTPVTIDGVIECPTCGEKFDEDTFPLHRCSMAGRTAVPPLCSKCGHHWAPGHVCAETGATDGDPVAQDH
jgi:uncharacterized protein YodC (DUF2158 family)/ribosomal protein L32